MTLTPILSSKTSARMTMLTAHALVSLYSPYTEQNICITTTALDVLHYQALGFMVFLDAKGIDCPCNIICPRNRRALDSGHGIDIVCWGGMAKNEGIPDAELRLFKARLFWTLGDSCHNVLCGRFGEDQD